MKKSLKLLTMMLCIVTLGLVSSCSKDNDYSELIVGKWKCVANSNSENVGQIYEFTSDGKLLMAGASGSLTYSISGSKITINYGADGEQYWEIKKLTEDDLTIYVDNSPFYEVTEPVTLDFKKI